jgi:hypothetical protein
MVKQYNSQTNVIFIVIILFIFYFIIKNFNTSTNKSIQHFSIKTLNRPLQEGVYKYDFQFTSSLTYPNGKRDTGLRTITNEDYGQRSISKGIVSYINNNGKLVTKNEYYEHKYLTDSQGKKIMAVNGLYESNRMSKLLSEKDDEFIYESLYHKSDLMSDYIKVISKYYKINNDYKIDVIYYNKNTKKYEPYLWGTLKRINSL